MLSGGSSHVISSSSKKSRSKESRKRVSAGITDNELSILPNSASSAHQMRKKSRQDTNISSEGYVLKSEFDALKAQMQQMQQMMELFQKHLIKNGVSISQLPSTKSTPLSVPTNSKVQEKTETVIKPLSLREQEILTENINNISPDKLPGVIQIIRESTKLSGDEEEIDLEIDQLDTATQRKLQRFVMQNVKSKRSKPKQSKKKISSNPSTTKAQSAAPSTTKPNTIDNVNRETPSKKTDFSKSNSSKKKKKKSSSSSSAQKTNTNSFFSFGSKDLNRDSSCSEDSDHSSETKSVAPAAPASNNKKEDSFLLPPDEQEKTMSSDEDDTFHPTSSSNWNKVSKINTNPNSPTASNLKKDSSGHTSSEDEEEEEDSLWSSARQHAQQSQSLDALRKTQKESLLQKTTNDQQARLEQATSTLKQKREDDLAAEARRVAEEEEKRNLLRLETRKQNEAVEATVDLEAQRDIMRKYEQSLEYDFGGDASPSSDFGF